MMKTSTCENKKITLWVHIGVTIGVLVTLLITQLLLPSSSGQAKIIPDGGTYYVGLTEEMCTVSDYNGATTIYSEGDKFPETINDGDVYVYGDYEYKYGYIAAPNEDYVTGLNEEKIWVPTDLVEDMGETTSDFFAYGWGVTVIDATKTEYEMMLSSINGQDVINAVLTYAYCEELICAPEIPNSVTNMAGTFYNCTSLTKAPTIPGKVENMTTTFYGCVNLTGTIEIDASPIRFDDCFACTEKPITLIGSSTKLRKLTTTSDDNVSVSNETLGDNQMLCPIGTIPSGAYYFSYEDNQWFGPGDDMPQNVNDRDHYLYGDYIYTYYSDDGGWCVDLALEEYSDDFCGLEYTWVDQYSESYDEILESINNESVTSMDWTFDGCTNLKMSPEIPIGVKSLVYTFKGCTSLTQAPEIPNSVTSLYGTFEGCTSLTQAPEIPIGVKSLGYTFSGCTSLTEAPEIPYSVTVMEGTFDGCISLKEAPEIPYRVENLDCTFKDCANLTQAPKIHDSVTDMFGTFSGCTSLTIAPPIPDSVKNMHSTFERCTSLTQAPSIPTNVTNMIKTFYGCTSLMGTIKINANPIDHNDCFLLTENSIQLTGISTMLEELAATDGYDDFSGQDNVRMLKKNSGEDIIPDGATYYVGVTSTAIGDYSGATEVYSTGDKMPAEVNYGDVYVYGDYEYRYGYILMPYENKIWMTNADIKETHFFVDKFSDYGWGVATVDTTKKEYETMLGVINGESVVNAVSTYIGCEAMVRAPELPDGVTNMAAAFAGCTNLTQAPVIPDSVVGMEYSFNGCTSLTKASEIPNGVTNLYGTFYKCASLRAAPEIPSSAECMIATFAGCTNLTVAPEIPDGVTSINGIFAWCTNLTQAPAIPDSIENMARAFEGCVNLTSTIVINANPSSYDDCFLDTEKPIQLIGSSTILKRLARTGNNGNVVVQ